MYAGGYLCRFAFQPPWSVFNSRQALFHCCISLPSISLNLHLAKYCVSQTRRPFALLRSQLSKLFSSSPSRRCSLWSAAVSCDVSKPTKSCCLRTSMNFSRKNFSCIRTAQDDHHRHPPSEDATRFPHCHPVSHQAHPMQRCEVFFHHSSFFRLYNVKDCTYLITILCILHNFSCKFFCTLFFLNNFFTLLSVKFPLVFVLIFF